jgi:hypothetical protein
MHGLTWSNTLTACAAHKAKQGCHTLTVRTELALADFRDTIQRCFGRYAELSWLHVNLETGNDR